MNIALAGRSSPTQLSRQSERDRPEITKELPAKGTDASRECEHTRCVSQSPVQRKEQRMSVPAVVDGIGFAAAGLVFATFCMRSMSALRWVAIVSNLAFIAYGYLGNLAPVLLLHLLLLPINICRLAQLRQRRTGAALTPCIRAPLRSRSFCRSKEFDIANSTTGRKRRKQP
jgi:hypothetical protein